MVGIRSTNLALIVALEMLLHKVQLRMVGPVMMDQHDTECNLKLVNFLKKFRR